MPIRLIVFFWLLLGATVSAKTLCSPSEKVLFSCPIKNSAKIASVCASPHIDRDQGYLQYRFGAPGKLELVYPQTRAGSQKQFYWREFRPYQSSLRTLTFKSGSYSYTLSAYDVSETLNNIKGGAQFGELETENTRSNSKATVLRCAAFPEGEFNLGGIVEDADKLGK